ncbi:MAG: TrbI/VirB10 family protein [Sebaldella sp.]|nr:TrbI/VirB10 family protein [Sebaldella sp.]
MNQDNEFEEKEEKKFDLVPKVNVKNLNKNVIYAIAGGVFIVIFMIALIPKKEKSKEIKEKINVSDRELITNLPSDYKNIKEEEIPDLKPVEQQNSDTYTPSTYDQTTYNQTAYTPNTYEQSYETPKEENTSYKKSKISFTKEAVNNTQNTNSQGTVIESQNGQNNQKTEDYDQNRQASKEKFLQEQRGSGFYLNSFQQSQISPYEIKVGSIIPAVLVTSINSDLPGGIIAQIRENVYDSTTGKHLLLPQGSKIYGIYDSNISYAQNRILIVWQRIVLPNGESIALENMPGVDLSGSAGLRDKTNYHSLQLLRGVVLSAVFGAGTAIVTYEKDGDNNYMNEAGRGAGENIDTIGQKMADKDLNRQPTIEIRQGNKFNILVHKDMILKPLR